MRGPRPAGRGRCAGPGSVRAFQSGTVGTPASSRLASQAGQAVYTVSAGGELRADGAAARVAAAAGVRRLVEADAEAGGHLVHEAVQLVVLRDRAAGVERQRDAVRRRSFAGRRPSCRRAAAAWPASCPSRRRRPCPWARSPWRPWPRRSACCRCAAASGGACRPRRRRSARRSGCRRARARAGAAGAARRRRRSPCGRRRCRRRTPCSARGRRSSARRRPRRPGSAGPAAAARGRARARWGSSTCTCRTGSRPHTRPRAP